ncbi:MAG: tRNA 2-thiouridine(34) synthase MnmA [Stellaceae bacterium]
MTQSKTRVIAAMSGGVDSAVAAALLAESGYDVIGVTMKMYVQTRASHAKSCCGSDDFDDARRSASAIGIPHYVLDFEEAFRGAVIERFAQEYALGRTPNPCVSCNNFVKLGTLRGYAHKLGAAYVATGHYARLEQRADGPHLFRSGDGKDQSYALASLRADQLDELLLPLGGMTKDETRVHARRFGLAVHDKPESQDICFVEGGDYRDVLERVAPAHAAAGTFVTSDGRVVGEHDGIVNYTVGQRRGLPASDGAPRYVTRIDAVSSTIVIGYEDELFSSGLIADDVNVIRPEAFAGEGVRMRASIRYRARQAGATATVEDGRVLRLHFDEPQRAVTPGQLVALYAPDGEEVVGAATIREAV